MSGNMTSKKLAAAYLRDAQACLDLAARGDAFQIAAAKYKVEEAQRLLGGPADEPGTLRAPIDGPFEVWFKPVDGTRGVMDDRNGITLQVFGFVDDNEHRKYCEELAGTLNARTWQPIETAPKNGTSFVAWCVRRIEGTRDTRIDPVAARWREPDGWIWTPVLRGGGQDRGTLTAWTAKPHPEFNCLHESERVNGDVLSCDDCGVMLEDFAMPSETKSDADTSGITAQQEETGRLWQGPRNEIPKGFVEIRTSTEKSAAPKMDTKTVACGCGPVCKLEVIGRQLDPGEHCCERGPVETRGAQS